jgi:hypothetical protein
MVMKKMKFVVTLDEQQYLTTCNYDVRGIEHYVSAAEMVQVNKRLVNAILQRNRGCSHFGPDTMEFFRDVMGVALCTLECLSPEELRAGLELFADK